MYRFFVVTTPDLRKTGTMSYRFMVEPGIPDEVMDCKIWGLLTLRSKDNNELNPWTGAVGDDGVQRWDLHLFRDSGFVLTVSVDADVPEDEGLGRLIEKALEDRSCGIALLMQRTSFDRFAASCKRMEVPIKVHHHANPLTTS
jgi:hypothetical protein